MTIVLFGREMFQWQWHVHDSEQATSTNDIPQNSTLHHTAPAQVGLSSHRATFLRTVYSLKRKTPIFKPTTLSLHPAIP